MAVRDGVGKGVGRLLAHSQGLQLRGVGRIIDHRLAIRRNRQGSAQCALRADCADR